MRKTLLAGVLLGLCVCFCNGIESRTATPEQFLHQVSDTIKSSHTRLTKMHNSGLNGMGKEEKRGGVSGTVTYWARKSKGILIPTEVTVDFIYKNYCDTDLTLNGTLTSTITDVMKRSGTMTGTVRTSSGSIRYDLEIISSDAAGGFYYIMQDSGHETAVSWLSLE
jgi:hypothetical protein